MVQPAAPAGTAARAAVLLESLAAAPEPLASAPGPSPSATTNATEWGAVDGLGAGSPPPSGSPPISIGGGGSGGDGGGTPGWQTGLLTVLVAAAVILAVVAVFMLITNRLRRQRRQLLTALARIQEAEMSDFQAGDLEAARRWHASMVARAMERRSRQQQEAAGHRVVLSATRRDRPGSGASGAPAPQPLVVIQPDLGVGLCTKAEPADGGDKRGDGAAGSSGGDAPSCSAGRLAAGAASQPAAASAAAGAGSDALQAAAGTAADDAASEQPLPPRLPMRLQQIALEVPGMGAAVLLLLPHQQGWLVWREVGGGHRAAPRGPLPPISSVEVRPEDASAAETGAGAAPAGAAAPTSAEALAGEAALTGAEAAHAGVASGAEIAGADPGGAAVNGSAAGGATGGEVSTAGSDDSK